MSARELWIVRHGEATPDQNDLSETGRQQADHLGARLAGVPFAAISHSPKARAVRTATTVAAHLPGTPVREAAELNDRIPPDDLAAMAAMIAKFTAPASASPELLITHNFQVGWFVREALAAPAARFDAMNSANTGLTVIRYPAGGPPRVLLFNDLSHLPAELRWTGLPPELRL
ncbi:phosphoglycerate mutase family protein [Actinoplanes sp. GCM10030250]|uniref:phosphoglycerate mutase family protein n=1 Tax=Actinoplanes sp. GCM10030250 TaxID=3273376 RepID=UPI00360627B8